uniref:Perlucin-like protein isoform X1 n=1 Tax=Crassostrea virginica TaxID=6565 RepID=A0A8B8AB24_CRAVI|nr:perlucin-like protein isoform X1 [Crassostrea virginica]
MEKIILLIFVAITAIDTVRGAGCPIHWKRHGASCYLFVVDVPEDFIEAGSFCQRRHSKLVEIESADENNFLRTQITGTHPQEGYWIGLSDIVFEGDWVWTSSQSSAIYSDWTPNQPDNYQAHQDCAMFFAPDGFHWNDHYCTVKAAYICEMEAESEPVDVIG